MKNAYYSASKQPNATCSWECLDNYNQACVLGGVDLSKCTISFKDVLTPGTYSFSLSATNPLTGASSKSSASTLEILSGNPPLIDMIPSKTNPSAADLGFYIEAKVDPATIQYPGVVSYDWSTTKNCDSNALLLNLTSPSVVAILPASNILKLRPNVLTPGAVYCFKVLVTDLNKDAYAEDKSNYAEISIRALQAPNSGTCVLSGATGEDYGVPTAVEFLDAFTITCNGWVTDSLSYPLYYTAERQTLESTSSNATWDKWSQVGLKSTSTVAKYVLGQGNYAIRLNVSDAASSQASQQISFVVIFKSGGANTNENALAYLEANMNSDITGIISALSAVSSLNFSSLSSDTYDSTLVTIQNKAIYAVNYLISGKVVLEDSTTNLLGGTLKNLLGKFFWLFDFGHFLCSAKCKFSSSYKCCCWTNVWKFTDCRS